MLQIFSVGTNEFFFTATCLVILCSILQHFTISRGFIRGVRALTARENVVYLSASLKRYMMFTDWSNNMVPVPANVLKSNVVATSAL